MKISNVKSDVNLTTCQRRKEKSKEKCRIGCLRTCCARSRMNRGPRNREKRKKRAENLHRLFQAFHRTPGVQAGYGSRRPSYGLGHASRPYGTVHGSTLNPNPGWIRKRRWRGEKKLG